MTREIELERDILRAIGTLKRPNANVAQLRQALPKGPKYDIEEVQQKVDAMYDDGLIDAKEQTPHLRARSRSYLITRLTPAGKARLASLLAA